jgi:membrane-bound lytic murein transglycosylase B
MTKTILVALAALTLAGCGNEAPAPSKPVAKATPAPVAQKAEPAPQAAPAAAPAAAPRAAEAPANANPNALLAEHVKKALEGASLQAAGIDVSAADGVVSLFGTVPSNEEKKRAATIAAKVDGVKSVQNKLAVVSGS